MNAPDQRNQLLRDGFCVVPGVLDARMLAETRAVVDRLIASQPKEHFERNRSTGSMIDVLADSFMAKLIALPSALSALTALGFDKPKFASGYIISKPPHSPQLFWHQDWWGWDDPGSYGDEPQQLFLMYYLVDTNRQNGCLRVIPGSHRKRHPLHDQLATAHTDEIRRAANMDNAAFQAAPGEKEVGVRAGELVIGDARVLHAAHANQTDTQRTVITLWYYPDFENASDPLRAAMLQKWQQHQQHFPTVDFAKLLPASLVPQYDGKAEPLKPNRNPNAALR